MTVCHYPTITNNMGVNVAIPEACGIWIEQRVQEELDAKGETGASLREIGRKVAAEVEKYFETRVNPETIKSRALRMKAEQSKPRRGAR